MKFIYVFLLLFLCGFKNYYKFSNNVEKIIIISKKESGDTLVVENKQDIEKMIAHLNNNKKQISKFIPKYKLEVYYRDSLVIVSINHRFISVNGLKLKLSKDLESFLDSYLIKHSKHTPVEPNLSK